MRQCANSQICKIFNVFIKMYFNVHKRVKYFFQSKDNYLCILYTRFFVRV